jgi:stage II sporulation protein R
MTFNQPEHEYIRFHVIANSDSPEDQELKLRVRDRLIERFGSELNNVDSIEQGRQKIGENLLEIKDVALQEIKRSGANYPVEVMFGRFPFPTKVYGNLVLPAGEYEALKVVIGRGKGANWWCVMFPPLCFVDISHGVVHESQSRIQDEGIELHQREEYEQDQENSEPLGQKTGYNDRTDQGVRQVEYRWKILEWLNGSREKVENLLWFFKH